MSKLLPLVVVLLCVTSAYGARFMSSGMDIHDDLPESVLEYQSLHGAEDAKAAADQPMLTTNMLLGEMEGLLADMDTKRKGWPIHIATKFLVKPDNQFRFIHRWQHFEEASAEHKGILHLSLNKVAGDNIVWSSYTVYKDFEAVFDHMRSEALRDFGSFILDTNIAVQYEMLFKVGGCRHKNGACMEPTMPPAAAAAAAADDDNKGSSGKGSWPIRFITKYIVPPSELHAFVEEWERLEKDLSGEKGNLALALFKPAADNTLFVSYSAWKSWSDFGEAARRKSTRQFLEFLGDKNIVTVNKKLWAVPAEHHHNA